MNLTNFEVMYNKASKVTVYPLQGSIAGYKYQASYGKVIRNYKNRPTTKQLASLVDKYSK